MKINVVGVSGSGKSTFSKALAEKLSFPYIEMDALFWGPNWHWPSDIEFFEKLSKALDQDHWVLDGNYTRSISIKWEQVDLVIWLDFSFLLTFWRALKRALTRVMTGEEIWPGTGNRESLRKLFSKESILWWMVKTHAPVRNKYSAMMTSKQYAHIQFLRLRSPEDAKRFLEHFQIPSDAS